MLRIEVQGPPGALAREPERALTALVDVARADGADPYEWLEKALRFHGATSRDVPVHRDARYQVVDDAAARVVALYTRAMTQMREAIRERLEQAARSVDLAALRELADRSAVRKAAKSTRLITPAALAEIARIIREHHTGIAAALFGKDGVSAEDWKLAVAMGLVDPDADPKGIAGGLYTFGAVLAHLDQAAASTRYGTTLEEFTDYIREHPVPQTELEHRAAQYAAHRGAQAIVGLGNKVGATVGSALIEADTQLDAQMRGTIRDVISARFGDEDAARRVKEQGIAAGLPDEFFESQFRSTIKRVVSDIGHATGDWARDIQRIAQTETHTAVQEGMKESWEEQEEQAAAAAARSPDRLKAYKLPRPGACPHCIRLHLDGDHPRVFYLDELAGNGTNVGRRAADWRAVIGSTHPWCSCAIARVPSVLSMPQGWQSGEAAPTVIGPGGRLVMP